MVETRSRLHAPEEARAAQPGFLGRFAKRALLKVLGGLREGRLLVSNAGEFGAGGGLEGRVEVHDEGLWKRALFGGDVGLGEAYVDGMWSSPDLVSVIRVAIRNTDVFDAAGGVFAKLGSLFNRRKHAGRGNTIEGSRRNIADHYDLGNGFYRLFLDDTLAYSCAFYEKPDDPLGKAQAQKFERICRKLRLAPRDHLLEIGTGWGGFAAHAALKYGCRITTTTISQKQFEYSKSLFARLGLGDRVTLLCEDYRNLKGTFDKAASIEMFEAVGLEHYDEYFGALQRLLAPHGTALIQTITMNERRFEAYRRRPDFIQKHVFPGAELASVSEILKSLSRVTTMSLFHAEEIGTHYVRTLREWRERFLQRLDDVRALGFD
ncbi:MAG: cyclopropane-fatty-acyl-phospholipid synthase family protein, partial [Planctomycetes bacterium]|nr:cyclopropane-fatty-acyl-phospholipid synthase family protein [Planctomycetota bacterium]